MKRKPELALLHPAFIGALAVLALNDHVWKRMGLPLSGKISDFAGLFVAPALMAALLRASSRRAIALCHLAVAIGFTLVKTLPPATHFFDLLLGIFLPSKTLTDPTDLIALPTICVAWKLLVPKMARAQAHAGHKLALLVGCGLCVATSEAAVPLELTVTNDSGHAISLKVRSLRSSVSIGKYQCPDWKLFRSQMFDDAPAETLSAGNKKTVIQNESGCQARWIEVDGLPPVLVEGDFGDDTHVALEAGPGAWNAVASGTVHINPMSADDSAAACQPPSDRLLTWSEPVPFGKHQVQVVGEVDGCLVLEVGGTQSWTVCLPEDAWPFGFGTEIDISEEDDPGFSWIKLAAGNLTLYFGRGATAPDTIAFRKVVTHGLSCAGTHDSCQTVWQNQQLVIDEVPLAAGEHGKVGDEDVWVTQAATRPIVDTACSSGPDAAGGDFGVVTLLTR